MRNVDGRKSMPRVVALALMLTGCADGDRAPHSEQSESEPSTSTPGANAVAPDGSEPGQALSSSSGGSVQPSAGSGSDVAPNAVAPGAVEPNAVAPSAVAPSVGDGASDGSASEVSVPPQVPGSELDSGAVDPESSLPERDASVGFGDGGASGVSIVGREIYVDGAPFHIRGVNWNPVPKGATHPDGLDYAGFADEDIALMKAAGINAVRTYERLEDHAVLDKFYAAGIYVFSTVYGWWQDDVTAVTQRVDAAKTHPAIAAWVIGNEWNYNQLYSDGQLSIEQTRDRLNEVAALIKAADPTRPVSTIWGGTSGLGEMVDAMPGIDLWGINVYQGLDNQSVFDAWQGISPKPMYLGEYGADAWDSRGEGQENPVAQAEAVGVLTQQLIDNYTTGSSGVATGGFIFEWADEWWKDQNGLPTVQDPAGIAPGGGPHPDAVFNEEYWGLVDIDRNPRPAYQTLRDLYLPFATE